MTPKRMVPPCSGGRTRTLNNWTRTSRVADYTTPEGWTFRLAEHLPVTPRPRDLGRVETALGRCEDATSPGSPGEASAGSEVRGMSRWSAYRFSAHASALGAIVVALVSSVLPAGPAAAGTVSPTLKVSPDRGLVNGQVVTVSGSGLTHSAGGSGLTWFVTQC